MIKLNIHEAKTHLSKYLELVSKYLLKTLRVKEV